MKNSFGLGSGKMPFGKKDKPSENPAQPKEPSYEKANQNPGSPSREFPTSAMMFDKVMGNNMTIDNDFYGQKNDNAKTVIDTITGYPRNVSPEIKSATVISEDAEITGDLKTQGDLNFMGVINGNIDMQGSMKASGTINGNVMASEATITGGKISGEYLKVSGSIMVDEVSVLECNVSTGSLNTAGKISGDIVAEQNVELDESAMVIGNITARSIVVKEGAKIEGTLKIGSFK